MATKMKKPGNVVSWENVREFGHEVVLFDGKKRRIENENLVLIENSYWGVDFSEPIESKTTIQNSYYAIKKVYDHTGTLIAERKNIHSNLLSTNKGMLKSVKLIDKNKIPFKVSESIERKFKEDDRKMQRKYAVHAQNISSVTFDELTIESKKEIEVRLLKAGALRVDFKELKHGNGVVVSSSPKHVIKYLLK
ncbi:hypothetical protein R6Z02_14695 [Carnobacterium maltaromaticum]|uniref:hypothetical protein n=1 Tax=Carnobacterium maltaromaticum TaxID=2751 RepID=UPI00298B3029|nr:hypothetical protein [Carnobacterium maltaromaticum]MDW5525002.1 hypothetical protein [Carnobacterium maltaromaticum]